MELRALSKYDNDLDTRYGDCILVYDQISLIVYDCGHIKHSDRVKEFLGDHKLISRIHIVISHNDTDHTAGVIDLMEYLGNSQYEVTVYSSLYLKSARKILEVLDDGRRELEPTKVRILKTFDHIKEIIEKAQELKFTIKDASVGTLIESGQIVGPKEEEFVEVVAQAIEDDAVTQIEGETVMNAASVQLKCKLDTITSVLLCGDASPSYLHNLDSYNVIQLPHHGNLDDAKRIFENLKDSYSKTYLISDNTGSGATSGGSDKLVQFMKEENYSKAWNTKDGEICIPQSRVGNSGYSRPKGVKLGEMDCQCR